MLKPKNRDFALLFPVIALACTPILKAQGQELLIAAAGRAGMGMESAAQSSATSSLGSTTAAQPAQNAISPAPISSPMNHGFLPGSNNTSAGVTLSAPTSNSPASNNTPGAIESAASSNLLRPTSSDSINSGRPASSTLQPILPSNALPARAPINQSSEPARERSGSDRAIQKNSPKSSPSLQLRGPAGESIKDLENESTTKSNSVDSFFQCGALQNLPSMSKRDRTKALITETDVGALQKPPKEETKTGSPHPSAGRFLWHFMDNLGIPMFYGNHDEALDPSIRRAYSNPKLPDINQPGLNHPYVNQIDQINQQNNQQNSQQDQPSRSGTTITGKITGKIKKRTISTETSRTITVESESNNGTTNQTKTIILQQKIPLSELEGLDQINTSDEKK